MRKFDLCKMSHPPQAKRRRIDLSLKTKIDLLWSAELVPKLNQKQLAEKFGIGTLTVSDIFKEKEEYEFLNIFHKSESSENRILSKPDIFKGTMVIQFCQFPLYIYMWGGGGGGDDPLSNNQPSTNN